VLQRNARPKVLALVADLPDPIVGGAVACRHFPCSSPELRGAVALDDDRRALSTGEGDGDMVRERPSVNWAPANAVQLEAADTARLELFEPVTDPVHRRSRSSESAPWHEGERDGSHELKGRVLIDAIIDETPQCNIPVGDKCDALSKFAVHRSWDPLGF